MSGQEFYLLLYRAVRIDRGLWRFRRRASSLSKGVFDASSANNLDSYHVQAYF